MSPLFHDPHALDPDRFSPGGKGKAKGIDQLLMAWLETTMGFLNDALQRRAYKEIFCRIQERRGERFFSYRYSDGHVGYIRDPAGVLVQETWSKHPDSPLRAFRAASIYGWGSTAGSALVQGKSGASIRQSPSPGDYYRYIFFDLRRMQASGARRYRPEAYRLNRSTGLLERTFD